MLIEKIKYSAGYKYQLERDYVIYTNIFPEEDLHTEYISLYKDGYLVIRYGYAWDGPSGPTFDTKSFMRGSLVHDALYRLMREKLLNKKFRKAIDRLLVSICLSDGMLKVRAWWMYAGVRTFAQYAARQSKSILTAP